MVLNLSISGPVINPSYEIPHNGRKRDRYSTMERRLEMLRLIAIEARACMQEWNFIAKIMASNRNQKSSS